MKKKKAGNKAESPLPEVSVKRSLLLERAVLCGDWMLRNQVTFRQDANKGRTIRSYDAKTKERILTGNWMTGHLAMCALALWKRTGEKKYLTAAERAGHYIMSLQVMDQDDPYYGAIRELTPQSIEFAPRDAAGGAWGLVWLAEATGDPEYRRRARLYGDWLVEKGMYRGWPMFAIYMDDELDHFYSRGYFQSGAGLFLHDLFVSTGDPKYIERGLLPIARIYRDDFINEDGSVIKERDPFTGKVTDPRSGREDIPVVNDDFGALMLIAASRLFDDDSYIGKAARYARWLASVQDDDGGFLGGKIPSGVPVGEITLRDIGTVTNDRTLIEAANRALEKLLTMQILDTGDSCIDGGFHGIYEGVEPDREGRTCVNMRTSGYALMAMLKAESDLKNIWLGLHNDRFRDHRWVAMHDLIW
jgi:hypothetical protein